MSSNAGVERYKVGVGMANATVHHHSPNLFEVMVVVKNSKGRLDRKYRIVPRKPIKQYQSTDVAYMPSCRMQGVVYRKTKKGKS